MSEASGINITDQMGRQISLPSYPKRIISLVPSQTEFLYDLGLTEEVVGQTLFCVHPANMHAIKPRIGGTKTLQLDKIRALKPDLIIANKEENTQGQIEELMCDFPVYISDISTLEDAIQMMEQIGKLVGKSEQASQISTNIKRTFSALVRTETAEKCLYLIWRKPYMAAGSETFIGNILQQIGFENSVKGRYPIMTDAEMMAQNPSHIFLSSEPYPFKDSHIQELQVLCPKAQISLVDGEMFSWYGSRLVHAAAYFKSFAGNK